MFFGKASPDFSPGPDSGRLADIGFRRWRQRNPRVGQLHQLLATAAQRHIDIAQGAPREVQARRLMVVRTAQATQLFFGQLLKPLHAQGVEVRHLGTF